MKTQQKEHKKLIRTKTQEIYLKKKNHLITFQNINIFIIYKERKKKRVRGNGWHCKINGFVVFHANFRKPNF